MAVVESKNTVAEVINDRGCGLSPGGGKHIGGCDVFPYGSM